VKIRMQPFHLNLASQSERRKDLLKEAGFSFDVITSDYEEIPLEGTPEEVVKKHALGKAKGANLHGIKFKEGCKCLILGSDTIVVFNKIILGKPRDLKQAKVWLKAMSGNYNEVYTGVALLDTEKNVLKIDYEISKVFFKKWSEKEIMKYLELVKVLDKAGAYAIQSEPQIVAKYIGSLSNIIGLPIEKLKPLLSEVNALL
jgi:septum formation protein